MPGSEKGVALIAALFLIIALAALATYMVTISGVQQQTPTLAADASRAWYAARSGIEIAAHEAINNGGCGAVQTTRTLDGFGIQTSCTATSHQERNQTVDVFVIVSTASRGNYGGLNYVSRTARGTITPPP